MVSLRRDPTAIPAVPSEAFSELFASSPRKTNRGRSPADRGPLIAVADGDFVYIRNEGDGAEELFNKSDDPHELSNRVGQGTLRPILDRFRKLVAEFRGSVRTDPP